MSHSAGPAARLTAVEAVVPTGGERASVVVLTALVGLATAGAIALFGGPPLQTADLLMDRNAIPAASGRSLTRPENRQRVIRRAWAAVPGGVAGHIGEIDPNAIELDVFDGHGNERFVVVDARGRVAVGKAFAGVPNPDIDKPLADVEQAGVSR